jgi:hypothetical protein
MAFERSKKNFTTKINVHNNLVNTPTPYEVTIAAKLEQLPVPDMMDSIWASIELQLDGDLPSDHGSNTPSTNPVKGIPGMGKLFYLSIIAAVIIAIVLIYKANKNDKKKNNPLPAPAKKEIVVPVADSQQHTITTPGQKNSSTPAFVNKADSSSNSFIPGNRISLDSLHQQALPFSKPDSSATLKNKPALPAFDSLSPPPLIKPRGVKGISNDDYRIQQVKKDSSKKGG